MSYRFHPSLMPAVVRQHTVTPNKQTMSIFEKAKILINNKLESWSLLDTSWENRPYDFYLVFGKQEDNKLPWITENWNNDFQPFIDLLIKQCTTSKETGLRATKYKPEKRYSKKDNQEFTYHSEIKLGRLKWDDKSHEKWTTPNNTEYYFQDFELWTPIWTICEKRESPPDIYLTISNESGFENNRKIQFDYFMVVAIAKNLNIESKPILRELSERINSKLTILKTRKWGRPEKVGEWTFVNWIQDTFSNGIYQGQNLHSIEFDKLKIEPTFEIIYKQN
jgi:hypothetical protein